MKITIKNLEIGAEISFLKSGNGPQTTDVIVRTADDVYETFEKILSPDSQSQKDRNRKEYAGKRKLSIEIIETIVSMQELVEKQFGEYRFTYIDFGHKIPNIYYIKESSNKKARIAKHAFLALKKSSEDFKNENKVIEGLDDTRAFAR